MSITTLLEFISQNILMYGGTFVLVLSLLVFIHEWGHYIIARLCGVRVEVFSIGFGKELFGWNDKNGTRWKCSLIPLGGYVKLFGDTDPASAQHTDSVEEEGKAVRPMTKEERDVAFFAKPVWKRAAVVFAGPAINYIFAIIVMAVLFSVNGQPVTSPVAGAVIEGSSADQYGFKPHDEILSIGGKEITGFEDIRREVMIALDDEKTFVINRGGNIIEIDAKAEKIEMEDRFGFKNSRGLLGLVSGNNIFDVKSLYSINGKVYEGESLEEKLADLERLMDQTVAIGLMTQEGKQGDKNEESGDGDKSDENAVDIMYIRPLKEVNSSLTNPDSPEYGLLHVGNTIEGTLVIKHGPVDAIQEALQETWDITAGTLEALRQIVVGTRSAAELGGVVRIGALAGDMVQQGFIAFILFTALLSINLGLINLFPIPLLDGGHLMFYAFEAVLGRPVPERVQEYAFRFGLVFLVGLMVFTNLNDIMQLIL